jgi:hypothetical protein
MGTAPLVARRVSTSQIGPMERHIKGAILHILRIAKLSDTRLLGVKIPAFCRCPPAGPEGDGVASSREPADEESTGDVIDLVAALKKRLGAKRGSPGRAGSRPKAARRRAGSTAARRTRRT